MNKKILRRNLTKKLRHTGLKLPIRARLAAFYTREEQTISELFELLKKLGLTCTEINYTREDEYRENPTYIYSDGKKGRVVIPSGELNFELRRVF